MWLHVQARACLCVRATNICALFSDPSNLSGHKDQSAESSRSLSRGTHTPPSPPYPLKTRFTLCPIMMRIYSFQYKRTRSSRSQPTLEHSAQSPPRFQMTVVALCEICNLPDHDICSFISVQNNAIEQVPADIGILTNLTAIYLNDNK